MPKRPSSASPSKSKKRKGDNSQNTLESFFKSKKSSQGTPSPSKQPVVIDVDALDSPPESEQNSKPKSVVPVSGSVPKKSPAPSPIPFPSHNKGKAPEAAPEFPPLDVDPGQYAIPSLASSSTEAQAPFFLLSRALVTLSQTRSRIVIINTLTNLLRTIITLSKLAASSELGIGSTVISQAIRQISGLSAAALRKLYNSTGDPGDVAFEAKSNIRTIIPHPPLTVPGVYTSLLKIANCTGQGSNKEKQKIVEKLLLSAKGEETRSLTRILCQNLRVGAVRTSILTALARALVWTGESGNCNPISRYPEAEALLKQVFVQHPTYDAIVPAVLDGGLDRLAERVPLSVGVPLMPMLGSPTRSLHEIYEKLGDLPFTAEFKYDGQRAQVHGYHSQPDAIVVKFFSRHLEDMTSKYPDVVTLVQSTMESGKIDSFIMDAEIVAIDPTTGSLKSFQELSSRPRKDVQLKDIQIAVCLFAFDLMYLDGESLLPRSFRQRRELLRSRFPRQREPKAQLYVAQFDFVESCDSDGGRDVIEEHLAKAVESKCEGLMVKLLDKAPASEEIHSTKQGRSKMLPSTYEPDIRTSAWLKLKKDYINGMGDSIDVIPIGAWHGNGRKAQWWSPILLALWDPEQERPVAVCKCMSGFTDAFYKGLNERYSLADADNCSRTPQWEADVGGFRPDVYFRPHEVWEIRGADITQSPVSTAAKGLVSPIRGLSIRFPRFIRRREDKSIENASQPTLLATIWMKQSGNTTTAGVDEGDGLVDVSMESSEVESEEEIA